MPYNSTKELPASVRVLPAAAQRVFLAAFNSAYAKVGEERAFKVGWGAVKNAGWHKRGEEWVKDEEVDAFLDAVGVHLGAAQIRETIVMDDDAGVRFTEDGYLVTAPRVARTGIQIYKGWEIGAEDESRSYRVYRPPEQVFARDSVATYTHIPVTNDHPPVLVDAANWSRYAVGETGEEGLRDGEFVRVPMMLRDKRVIDDWRDGKRELSLGYTMDLKWGAGVTSDGQEYDAVQTAIRANHLAVVAAARGGPKLRIGDDTRGEESMTTRALALDGITIQLDQLSYDVVTREISRLTRQLDEFKTEKEKKEKEDKEKYDALAADSKKQTEAKDAEITTLKQAVKDATLTPDKIEAMVADRAAVAEAAKKLIGDKLITKDKTVADMRRQVVDVNLGDKAKGWSDDQVRASFDSLVALGGDSDGDRGPRRGPLERALGDREEVAGDERDKALDERDAYLRDAWKRPIKVA